MADGAIFEVIFVEDMCERRELVGSVERDGLECVPMGGVANPCGHQGQGSTSEAVVSACLGRNEVKDFVRICIHEDAEVQPVQILDP